MPKKSVPKTPAILDIDEFKIVVDRVAYLQQKEAELKARLERALSRIRAKYDAKLGPLTGELTAQFKRATKFAVRKRTDLFPGKGKTSCTALAEYGFRNGKPALKLSGDFEWEDVKDAIKARLEEIDVELSKLYPDGKDDHERELDLRVERQKWNELLVTKTEIVKDAIKTKLTDAERETIGTVVEQGEVFWIDAKKEKQPQPVEAAA